MCVVFHSRGLYHTASHVKLLDSCCEDILDVVQTDLFQYMGFWCLGDDLMSNILKFSSAAILDLETAVRWKYSYHFKFIHRSSEWMSFKYRVWHCLSGQLPWAARAEELTINILLLEVPETTYCPADQNPTHNIQNYIHKIVIYMHIYCINTYKYIYMCVYVYIYIINIHHPKQGCTEQGEAFIHSDMSLQEVICRWRLPWLSQMHEYESRHIRESCCSAPEFAEF